MLYITEYNKPNAAIQENLKESYFFILDITFPSRYCKTIIE